MEEPPPIPERAVEEFSFDPGSGSDTSESSAAPTIAPGTNYVLVSTAIFLSHFVRFHTLKYVSFG